MEVLTSLLLIVGIDLILAGDNAIVIGLAARRLPEHRQKKAVIWGTVGAIAIRLVATLVVVWLLQIPGLNLIGGLLLLWIAYKLLVDEKDHGNIKASQTLGGAIRTIVVADALMGIDNVLAVAGAAHGNYWLVAIGLLISVPIIIWGSTMFIKLVERFPWMIYAGAGVLAFTAAKMITHEGFLQGLVNEYPIGKWLFIAVTIILVLLTGIKMNKRNTNRKDEEKQPVRMNG
ncbi:MAG TPA: TerC family protein [Bacillales bacterium]|nr:TerC family protein [Bacillales bacterium]